jgi:hypothetical protein
MNGCLVAAIFKQILHKKNETALLTRREEKKKVK